VPAYNFVCKLHKALVEITRISMRPWNRLSPEERLLLATCPQQNGLGKEIHQMERAAKGPTAHKKESLDNGAMKRRVERFVDAEKLYKDRAKQNS
jgi:hypothetical protein